MEDQIQALVEEFRATRKREEETFQRLLDTDSVLREILQAAKEGDEGEVRTLLYKDPGVLERAKKNGKNVLTIAIEHGRLGLVRLLLRHLGTQALWETDETTGTTLHTAASGGHEDMVSFLISQGVDAHGVDRDGRTPFITACDQGRLGAARLLLEHMGPEALVHVDEEGCTALHSAAYGGHEELVTFLLSKGAYPNGSDVTGMTPFTWACRRGHVGVARLLLPHLGEEDLQEMKNEEGMTPLHEAVSEGHEEMTAFLLSEGVYTDSRNDDGKTPLMLASVRGHAGMVQALLQHLQGQE